MLEIFLLGRFEVQHSGKRVLIKSRQAQSLLAYLLINVGRQLRREKVAGMLWPEIDEDDARAKLRYGLWQLRGALGGEYIVADRLSVAFNQDSKFHLDLSAFKIAHPEKAEAAALIDALTSYEGELLPGFYDEWIAVERSQIDALFEREMVALINILLVEERWTEVIEWGEKWVGLGQSHETAFRSMMIAYAHLGDTSQAVTTYRRCVDSLSHNIGVEPSPETQELLRAIVEGEKPISISPAEYGGESSVIEKPVLSLPTFLTEEKPANKDTPTFVGRDIELSFLNRKLELAMEGEAHLALVSGGSGRGKSSLVNEFGRRAQEQYSPMVVAKGSGEAQTGSGDPLLPFRDILKMLSGEVELKWNEGRVSTANARRLWKLIPHATEALLDLGPDLIDNFLAGDALVSRGKIHGPAGAAWLKRLELLLQRKGDLPIPINVEHSDLQSDLFEQYTNVLKAVSQKCPLLLLLDDFQWADIGSISLLFHLARRLRGQPLLIVVIYRPDELALGRSGMAHPLEPILGELKGSFDNIELNLDKADDLRGNAFVDALLDSEPNQLSDSFRRALHLHTGGHALFTIELLHQFQEQGDLQKDELGKWIMSRPVNWDILPVKVEAVISVRVNRLPLALRKILNVACIEGEEFSAEVISEALGLPLLDVINALSQGLDQRHLLVRALGIQLQGPHRLSRYAFRHHFFYRYLYDSLDSIERPHLHQKVGEILETLYDSKKDYETLRLAWHFEEAGAAFKAAGYYLLSGEQAKRVSANREAIDHLQRGLALVQHLPADSDRYKMELALQVALGAPLVAVDGWSSPEVESAYERARELCERTGDVEHLAPVLWGLWSYYLVRVQLSTAQDLAGRLLDLADDSQELALKLVAHWTMGITLAHSGELNLARQHLVQAVDLYQDDRHRSLTYLYGQNPGVTCCLYLAIVLLYLGYPDQAKMYCQRGEQIAEQGNHLFSQAFAQAMSALFYVTSRTTDTAFVYVGKAVDLASEGHFPFIFGLALTVRGWVLTELGKSRKASRIMSRGLNAMEETGAGLARPLLSALLAEVLVKEDQPEQAYDVILEAIEAATNNSEYLNQAELFRIQGQILGRLGGNYSVVDECFRRSINIAQRQGARLLELRSNLAYGAIEGKYGVKGTRRKRIEELYLSFTEGLDSPDLLEAKKWIDQDKGDLVGC